MIAWISPLASRSDSERPDAFSSIERPGSCAGGAAAPCEPALLVAPCTQWQREKSTPYSSCSMPRMITAAVWV